MKPNKILAALIILSVMVCSTTTFAQLYKTDYTTKIVLTNSGFPTNPAFIYTLTAPATMTGPLTLTLPNTQGNLGDVLTNTGGGVLAWQNPLTSITLGGDVSGAAGNNTVDKIKNIPLDMTGNADANILIYNSVGNKWATQGLSQDVSITNAGVASVNSVRLLAGPSIALAINNNTAPSINGNQLNHDLTLTTGGATPFALGIDLTHDNSWTSTQTFTGATNGVAVSGGATLSVNGANSFQYVDGFQQLGYVLTSDGSGNAKWTDPSTSVTLAGDITGPAGANVIAATANAGNHAVTAINLATANTLNADVLKHDLTLTVATNQLGIDLTHDNSWTSTQTFTGATNGVAVSGGATLSVNGANSFQYVDGFQQLGYVLTSDGSGNAKWTDPGIGVTLTGDVSGAANNNTVDKIKNIPLDMTGNADANILIYNSVGNKWATQGLSQDVSITNAGVASVNSVRLLAGPSIALAINNNTAPSINGNQLNHDLTLTTGGATPFALGIDLTHDNSWTSTQTFTGATNGVAVSGGATLSVNGANSFQYVDGFQQLGYVLTSDGSGNAKWTDPSTSVTLAGDITGPAGANVIAATANAGNHAVTAINLATANTLNADVLKHDLTLTVATNQLGIDLNHANVWGGSGSQEFGATAQTPNTIAFAAILPIGTSNTLYKVTGTGTATGMANGADGRNVTLTNTGGAFITLTSNAGGANQFLIPGGDPVIMGPNATVMLQYDAAASGWRVIGGF